MSFRDIFSTYQQLISPQLCVKQVLRICRNIITDLWDTIVHEARDARSDAMHMLFVLRPWLIRRYKDH